MEFTTVKELYHNTDAYIGKEITVGGWVRSNRDSKAFGFIVLHDGTFFETLQVVYSASAGELCRDLQDQRRGSCDRKRHTCSDTGCKAAV